MVIGVLEIELFLPAAQSLKEKRMVLKSLKTRLRNKFNVSVAELDNHDKWQRTNLGIASISNVKRDMNSLLTAVLSFVDSEHSVETIRHSMELL